MQRFAAMRRMSLGLAFASCALFCLFPNIGARAASPASYPRYDQSLDFCPMSPLFKIYAIHYCQRLSPNNEIIVGPLYTNIHYEDIGYTDAWGFIAGYRRYLWKALHVDYQLMPQWDHFYETNEQQRYEGFDLWNEFRLGYMWDFRLADWPLFVNVQWPFGFALYSESDGKPESFKQHAEDHPYFYFPPMFFLGVRF
jgi:hypothetical protein